MYFESPFDLNFNPSLPVLSSPLLSEYSSPPPIILVNTGALTDRCTHIHTHVLSLPPSLLLLSFFQLLGEKTERAKNPKKNIANANDNKQHF